MAGRVWGKMVMKQGHDNGKSRGIHDYATAFLLISFIQNTGQCDDKSCQPDNQ